ncbi:MAG: serine/threonine-protein phosphatase [Kiritimatiellae bacterium]|nr:serine/threonine-protein phosphatase [Kiritimatiellia bacterium]
MNILHLFKRFRPHVMDVKAAALTDCGLVRKENQDAFLMRTRDRFFCVADGMGGGDGGALASQWTCGALDEVARPNRGGTLRERMEIAQEALKMVNRKIREYAYVREYRQMGTTVAFAVFDPRNDRRAAVCHAGDSRIYRFRDGRLSLLTKDHTIGGELSRIAAERVGDRALKLNSRANPLAHVLTRAVGPERELKLEWRRIDVRPGDGYLLCSDGVHDMLTDEQIALMLGEKGTPDMVVLRLDEAIRAAGAADNYTMVYLKVGE